MSDNKTGELRCAEEAMNIVAAAIEWNNERIRINRTTYSADVAQQCVGAADSKLMTAIDAAWESVTK